MLANRSSRVSELLDALRQRVPLDCHEVLPTRWSSVLAKLDLACATLLSSRILFSSMESSARGSMVGRVISRHLPLLSSRTRALFFEPVMLPDPPYSLFSRFKSTVNRLPTACLPA
jgi:hypothetical protein